MTSRSAAVNAAAVQHLMAQQQSAAQRRARSAPRLSSSYGGNGDSGDGSAARTRQPQQCRAEAAMRMPRNIQPDWQQSDRRGLQREGEAFKGHLDPASHLSQQLSLAAEMGTLPSSPSNDPVRHSNFEMTVKKASHSLALPSTKAAATPWEGEASDRKIRRMSFHHEVAIARHEQTLPLRRAADPYVSLTAAQADARYVVPNEYTLGVMSERYGGAHPVLENRYHQRLYKNEPLMSHLLRGSFYGSSSPGSSGGQAAKQRSKSVNILRRNMADVRKVSSFNREVRLHSAHHHHSGGDCCCHHC